MTCALSRVNKKERVRHQQHKESLLLLLQLLLLFGCSTSQLHYFNSYNNPTLLIREYLSKPCACTQRPLAS